jgi:hypothetical protein
MDIDMLMLRLPTVSAQEHNKLFDHYMSIFNPRDVLVEGNVLMSASERAKVDKPGLVHNTIDAAALTGHTRKRMYWSSWKYPDVSADTNGPMRYPFSLYLDSFSDSVYRNRHILEYSKLERECFPAYTRYSSTEHPKCEGVNTQWTNGPPHNVLIDKRGSRPIVRRFNVSEIERLLGFPAGWTDTGTLSATQRLRLLGHEGDVSVLEYILKYLP